MPSPNRTLTLSATSGLYAIVKLAHDAAIPDWATQGGFFSVTRTADELSLVTAESSVPAGIDASRGWRLLKVHGPFAFSEIGIVASLANPLARIGVGIFVISTFDTDYLSGAAGRDPRGGGSIGARGPSYFASGITYFLKEYKERSE